MATLSTDAATISAPRSLHGSALHWIALLLVVLTWLSGAIFGLYIISFFGGMVLRGSPERWNESLPHLHDATTPLATIAIGAHFVTGGVLLLFGPIQLIGRIRRTVPTLHRWLGRIYVLCAGFAGLGGLGFILAKGTIGGAAMSTGFGIYGALMTLGAALTYASAHGRRYEQHRAWAIRLFALTVGSWLYRIEYGFWFLTAGRFGHSSDFSGWFDAVMSFLFYLPNLAVAECFIRGRRTAPGSASNGSAAIVLFAASLFVMVATWKFTADYWGPGMVSGISGTRL